jgi:methionyl aminopeptidase
MIPIKTDADIQKMRESGRILGGILRDLTGMVKEGVSTAQIDKAAAQLIDNAGVIAAFKGYRGYPATLCASVNEEVVHGIPDERILRNGDIVSIDIGISHKGFFSDAAVTLAIGHVPAQVRKLIDVTRNALGEGIKAMRLSNRLSDISHAVQRYVEANGFSVVRQFVGHGIGRSLHEEPEIPNFGQPYKGPHLQRGMVFAIEPMVNMGSWECEILGNGWTAVTRDGKYSAHFEHTVAVTENGTEILTRA